MSGRVTKKDRAFAGVRLEVTTSAGFDVVLDRSATAWAEQAFPKLWN